ncbi:hypothetical protein AAG906_015942 [Vitis piasezkii]
MDESYAAISTTYLPSGIWIILNAIRCKRYDSRVGDKVIAIGTWEQTSKDVTRDSLFSLEVGTWEQTLEDVSKGESLFSLEGCPRKSLS